MDNADKCKVMAGLSTDRQPRLKRMRKFTCQICFDDDGTKETIALSCDHRYCRDCYTSYLNQKIQDGESKRIQCMATDCPLIVDEKTVELLVDEQMSNRCLPFLFEKLKKNNTITNTLTSFLDTKSF